MFTFAQDPHPFRQGVVTSLFLPLKIGSLVNERDLSLNCLLWPSAICVWISSEGAGFESHFCIKIKFQKKINVSKMPETRKGSLQTELDLRNEIQTLRVEMKKQIDDMKIELINVLKDTVTDTIKAEMEIINQKVR